MSSVVSTLSEYTYFYISKNITWYTVLLVFQIVEYVQYILKSIYLETWNAANDAIVYVWFIHSLIKIF